MKTPMKKHAFTKRALSALALILSPACADIDPSSLDDSEEEVGYSEAALELAPGLGNLPVQINIGVQNRIEIGPQRPLPVVIRKDHDFNADGHADIAWHDDNGETSMWLMRGAAFSSVALPRVDDKNWQLIGSGDFNHDRQADLVWRNVATGQISIWFMNGTTYLGYNGDHWVSAAEWEMQGVSDFNKDGRDDILWRRNSDGLMHVWLMNGTRIESTMDLDTKVPDKDWQVGGIGDFDRDGDPDIAWRYLRPGSKQGENVIWRMDGNRYTGSYALPWVSDLNWQMRSAGDYNSDGQTDLAWRNTATGQVSLWFMKRTTVLQQVGSASPSLSWKMSGAQQTPAKPGQRPESFCGPGYHRVEEFDTELKKWLPDCELNTISCAPGTVQDGTVCVSCGGSGEVACPGKGCDPGFAAYTGFCQPCGKEGLRSCGADARGCEGSMELHNNLCRTCGALGQPVCITRAACDPGGEAWHGTCRVPVRRVPEPHEGCGGFKESCCTNPIYTTKCTDPAHVCRGNGFNNSVEWGSDVCREPKIVNRDPAPSAPKTCSGAAATSSAQNFALGVRDANGCALGAVAMFANSASEAVGCAQALEPRVTYVTSGSQASYDYAQYSHVAGTCANTQVAAFSQDDAFYCAQATCINCTVQQGKCQ